GRRIEAEGPEQRGAKRPPRQQRLMHGVGLPVTFEPGGWLGDACTWLAPARLDGAGGSKGNVRENERRL
ncbi:hypothetical protein ACX83E_22145, partial [Burkholderia pseudomallei]